MTEKTVVVAMSGGVDSSVTALLLKQQGYRVIGLTGLMLNDKNSRIVVDNAKRVSDKLKIEHFVYDASKIFEEKIINYFINTYRMGETPNPCIMCNQFIKWGILFDYAINKLNADIFSTGHYADIRCDNGIYKLYPAVDDKKDQLYFLYRLRQYQLSRTIFPLSQYKKEQIKQIAIDYDLPPKDSKESQDICFIKKPVTTKSYLEKNLGLLKGNFLEVNTGKILGEHYGYYKYTIGQRRGIGIAYPYPLYVINLDSEKNIVYVGPEKDNYKNDLVINNLNFCYELKEKEFKALVKIRYNMPHKCASVKVFDDYAQVAFDEPINSVTKGQSCVIYDINDVHLIGGGIIS